MFAGDKNSILTLEPLEVANEAQLLEQAESLSWPHLCPAGAEQTALDDRISK